jgi:hypothetical protein
MRSESGLQLHGSPCGSVPYWEAVEIGAVTYANFLTEGQANLWNLLKADATVLSYTKNILDGVPLGLTEGTGFPYIIVPTPTVSEEHYITFSKKIETVVFRIDIFDRKESVSRLLGDAVRSCIETNKATFGTSYGMYRFINASTSLSYVRVDDRSVVYDYALNIEYEWVAW